MGVETRRTMTDHFGDKIEVWGNSEYIDRVYALVHDGSYSATASLTIKQARKLRKLIKLALRDIGGVPAPKPTPEPAEPDNAPRLTPELAEVLENVVRYGVKPTAGTWPRNPATPHQGQIIRAARLAGFQGILP